jgi:hypothetical protein
MKAFEFNSQWMVYDETGREQAVTLPHDAMIHRRRDAKNPSGGAQAFFPGGAYTYEKVFEIPEEWANKHILFHFEGVYKNAKVYLNEKEVGGTAYGYIPFFVCADGLLKSDGKNVIRVEAENTNQPDSRWYSGAGIYRPVWVWVGDAEHIEPEGIRIMTLSYSPPHIRLDVAHTGGSGCELRTEILDGENIVASGISGEIKLPDAKLWNDETPHLYTCRITLKKSGRVCDTAETRFGIRKLEWNAKGLFVNGKRILLRGGCVHHDNGILGATAYDKSEFRRVKKLKEAGYNAIRSSHNPASRAMLEAADRYGVYIIDETWDMWFHHKNKYDYAADWRDHYKNDLKAMVERDFNHPSVIMYSIGNEVSEPAKDEGLRVTHEMVNYLHGLDSNRAVTGGFNLWIISSSKKGKGLYKEEGGLNNGQSKNMSGMNSTMFNIITSAVGTNMNKTANSKAADEATTPCLDELDIAGYNYASGRYPLEGKAHPNRVVFGSETFPQDIAKNWEMVQRYPFLVGDFMWAAWDYLGETGLGAWAYTPDGKGFDKPYPWLLAECGAFDILGNPGAPVAFARAVWALDQKPYIGVQPLNHPGIKPAKAVWRGTNALASWAWDGCRGNDAIVEVYSSAAAVELLLNGKSIGGKKTKQCKAVFKTKYIPGKLEAIAYDTAGKKCAWNELLSATGEIRLRVTPEELDISAGDICYVDIALVGENGVVESNADETLTVTVNGGVLLAFGSANPRTEERYDSGRFTTYYGRAQAVVCARDAGTLTITVSGKEKSITANIAVKPLNNKNEKGEMV